MGELYFKILRKGLKMKVIKDTRFSEERALYGANDLKLINCSFDGEEDGESALKEASDIEVKNCFCNLRYPFWHDDNLKISDTTMTDKCRAALWYSNDIEIKNAKMLGIKALRECHGVIIEDTVIDSPEFGWSSSDVKMENVEAASEYFMLRSADLDFDNVKLKGKYSFQYLKDAEFKNCNFDTKDCLWHAEDVVIKDSIIKGEYLAWYSNNLTFINCEIRGTQPFCYCKNLKLINCKMLDADLAFEKSEVEAEIITPMISIKNPYKGNIKVPSVDEIIMDDPKAKGNIIIMNNN